MMCHPLTIVPRYDALLPSSNVLVHSSHPKIASATSLPSGEQKALDAPRIHVIAQEAFRDLMNVLRPLFDFLVSGLDVVDVVLSQVLDAVADPLGGELD